MSPYSVIEIFSLIVLSLILIGLATKRDKSQSSKALAWACWGNLLCSAANAAIYMEYEDGWPTTILFCLSFFTYVAGNITMLLFTYYDYCYIREYTPIKKWIYGIPMGLCLFNSFLSFYSALSGDVFTSNGGVYIETKGLPIFIFLLYFACIIYLPVAAATKYKELGAFKFTMLALFSTFPLIALIFYALEMVDYTYASGAISLLAMYIFLDNELVRKQDEQIREEMQKHQAELEKARALAESANVAKTTFLFNMSHDIRTPMNAIIGYTQLMDKHLDEPEKGATTCPRLRCQAIFCWV